MKSFKKFVFITLTLLLLIAVLAIINTQSFEDLRYSRVNFYMLGFFSVISFCYIYIYEKMILKKIKTIKTYGISIASVFFLNMVFSSLCIYLFFKNSDYEVIIFQSTLSVCVFLLIVFVFEIYKKSLPKESITLNEKSSSILLLILKTALLLSFFLLIMICGPLINQVPQKEIIEMTVRVLLSSFQITLISFIILRLFYISNYFRKNVVIGVLFSSVISSLLSIYLNTLLGEILLLHFTLFFLVCLFCCSLIVIMLLYKSKIQNLSLSFSKKETEYLQLKNQINPHFLFNNLNILIAFIETNPQKAIEFGHHLSNVYRHYLKNDDNDFVLLNDELQFISEYLAIFKAKFESGFTFEFEKEPSTTQYILSLSLQELIDNIFKHNILDKENPVVIKIMIHQNELIINNTKISKEAVISTKKGLENINKRYNLLTKKEITVTDNENLFEVKIPILHLTK